MHLIALVERVDHVCCRYRIEAFRARLESAGHALSLEAIPRGWVARWALFRRLRGQNVLLQRKLLSTWDLLWLRSAVRRLFFDLDDAVFLRDSYSASGLYDARRLARFRATASRCDAVIAGNGWLADQSRRVAPGTPAIAIPTCVEPGDYPIAQHPRRDRTRLVWVGSSSTLQGLEQIRPILETIGEQVPDVALKIVCDRFPTFTRLPTLDTPWQADSETREIADSDIGISWIPDDDWSRGKCGLKILQYMAAGLPVVANPVGVHPEMVRHGETGYLVRTPGEWVEAIRTLAANPDLRRRMGRAARERVEREYSVRAGAMAWLDLLERVESRKRAG